MDAMDEDTSGEEIKRSESMAPDLRQTLMKFDPVFLDLRHTSLNALLKGSLESGSLPVLGKNGDSRTLDLSQTGTENQDIDSSDEFSIIDRNTPTAAAIPSDVDDVSDDISFYRYTYAHNSTIFK